ncbi:MAG: hypothetical protein RLZZ502_1696 [Pseudomonadota bacterium]|jgi:two-component system sensor histidine kinase QseC
MRSIKSRLQYSIFSIVIFIWVGVSVIVLLKMFHEAEELIDGELVSASRIAAYLSAEALVAKRGPHFIDKKIAHDYELLISLQQWSTKGELLVELGPQVPFFIAPVATGFKDLNAQGQAWRSYSEYDASKHLWVRTLVTKGSRDALAYDVAETFLYPLLLSLAVVSVLAFYLTKFVLHPIYALSERIEKIPRDKLSPIVYETPQELHSLVFAINDLINKLNQARELEKEFITVAAHELRTPLTNIQLHSENALSAREAEQRVEVIQLILNSSKRATHLVNQLLNMAMLEATQNLSFAALDVTDMINECLPTVLPLADTKKVQIVIEGSLNCGFEGNKETVAILFRNLLVNAVHHSPRNARIIIRYEKSTLEGIFRVQFIDQGPGVRAQDAVKIFQKFSRTAPAHYPGSGLGLAIAKRIVDMHFGHLYVGNPDEKGAVFIVEFPLQQAKHS